MGGERIWKVSGVQVKCVRWGCRTGDGFCLKVLLKMEIEFGKENLVVVVEVIVVGKSIEFEIYRA